MWEGSYGKEPFDMRLTVLRIMSCWKLIVMCTLAGTLALGGFYCVKNILLHGEKQYKAESTYRVDYAVADEYLAGAYINDFTWNTYVHTEEFLNDVRSHLGDSGLDRLSDDELGGYIEATIESDWRVAVTDVTTESPAKSEAIARAVEETMVQDFPEGIRELESIRVIDSAGEAEEVIPDIRVGRAFVLAAVLSLFFILTGFLLKETGDDSIWLPSTIRRRYGIKVLGTIESRELAENIGYLFEGREKAAVCTVQEDMNPAEIADAIERVCRDTHAVKTEFYPVPAPILCPESTEVLRKAQGILLAVKAGAHAGKQLEYVMEYLAQQDCEITAVILWNADETLLRRYYRFTRKRQ